jgi:hypothetical protein
MTRSWLTLAVLLFSLAGTSQVGWAQKRIAVAQLDGDAKGTVAAIVVKALEEDYTVIAPKAVTKVADELAVTIDDKQGGKLMTELEADVLVTGSVEKSKRGHKLTLRVLASGSKKSRSAFILYGKKPTSPKLRGGIRAAVSTILEKDGGGEGSAGGDEAVAEPASGKTGKAGKGGRDSKVGTGVEADVDAGDPDSAGGRDSKGEGDSEGANAEAEPASDDDDPLAKPAKGARTKVADREEDDDSGEVTVRAKSSSEPGLSPVSIAVGPSLSSRTLKFNSRANFAQAPKNYKNPPVPGVRVSGQIFPGAFGGGGVLSHFGVGFELDQTVGLKVNTAGMQLATVVRNYEVDARIRLPFGNKVSSPQVLLVGGYARRTFKVTRGDVLVDLPDVDYKMFNPGLMFRFPIGAVAIFGDARFLLMRSAGTIQTTGSYGPAKITAFDAEAGLEYRINRRFAVQASGDFVRVGFDFKGTGLQSNNRDGDAGSIDVGGAAEVYVGGALTLAVAY